MVSSMEADKRRLADQETALRNSVTGTVWVGFASRASIDICSWKLFDRVMVSYCPVNLTVNLMCIADNEEAQSKWRAEREAIESALNDLQGQVALLREEKKAIEARYKAVCDGLIGRCCAVTVLVI